MNQMKTRKKASAGKRRVAKRGSGKKTGTRKASGRAKSRTPTRHTGSRKIKSRKPTSGETYLFECTRQGCGYRIVREEKFDQGQLRVDLKCPKCHNREFRCLGPGDLPEAETMELALPTTAIDLDNISPIELGSN